MSFSHQRREGLDHEVALVIFFFMKVGCVESLSLSFIFYINVGWVLITKDAWASFFLSL